MICLYNSLTFTKEVFSPLCDEKVTMYVCGPTVYDVPHVGNLRSIVVYDTLYRVLSTRYDDICYVRNITDVDDKIINASRKTGANASDIAQKYTDIFHDNIKLLGCALPTIEPKATEHIKDMIQMIETLITKGHAYVGEGNVYFDVASYLDYMQLSKRNMDDMVAGNRVEIEHDKRNYNDFALWKKSEGESYISPWGMGRPGWHIECSVMSTKYLGQNFDIHGGGVDLKFPHHENEIAQSCCANPGSFYAKYWIHNGFLMVDEKKMSKSIGNVLYLNTLLERGISAEEIRYMLLSAHYRKPLNWTDDLVKNSQSVFRSLKRSLQFCDNNSIDNEEVEILYQQFLAIIYNDLNTPMAFTFLHNLTTKIDHFDTNRTSNSIYANAIKKSLHVLGFKCEAVELDKETIKKIESLIAQRTLAKKNKDFISADLIRDKLLAMGIVLQDGKDGISTWSI